MKQESERNGLTVAIMVAGVYGYFLLFSQFAFLERVQLLVEGEARIKAVLAAMAIGGIIGAFAVMNRPTLASLRTAYVGCALAALASTVTTSILSLTFVSGIMGLSLGAATVILATLLPQWLHSTRACLWVGIGTGQGYALCNVPSLFLASPAHQCFYAAAMMGSSFVASWCLVALPTKKAIPASASKPLPLVCAVLVFFALVWFDSGAFYVIQHVPELKKATWGDVNLWRNAGLHFFAAVLAGYLLGRGQWRMVILSATILLSIAVLWLQPSSTRLAAGWLYPIAVSFYSTALVCWPGLLHRSTNAAKRAAWVFAVAGWIGSAMGIGMVEKLHVVPLWFVATASIVILACLYQRHVRSLVSIAFLVILSATMILVEKSRTPEEIDTIARGKQVYIAEGCIHCHSQYLRPGSQDERYWGDAKSKAEVLAASPVMIGNRRQGPDLTHVSGRRSDAWLREHFIAPRLFAPDSAMPSYAHLFQDRRGDDLIAFLTRDRATALSMMQQRWQQSPAVSEGPSDLALGQKLFARHCSACHGINGGGDGPLANKLSTPVANLANGPYRWTQTTVPRDPSLIDRVIRHGIPGTDMPGHETFSDEQVRSLRQWVIELYKKPESF